jgi:hypothetical protein
MMLRDLFAAHVAAALAHRVDRPEAIAARAYDLADAMMTERARRMDPAELDADAGAPIALDPDDLDLESAPANQAFARTGLLDEPAPVSEREDEPLFAGVQGELDPAWLERDFDPRWEAEPHWGNKPPGSERPGLARTQVPAVQDDKRKSQA